MKKIYSYLFTILIVFTIIGCDSNSGGDFKGDNTTTPTSKIKLLSPSKKSINYSYVTLEVKDNVSDVKAKVNDNEYKGIKNGNSFFIYNVALKNGKNEIELIANNGKDKLKVNIDSEGKGVPPIGLNIDKREGFEKLDTTIKIQTSLSASKYFLDKDSDGLIDETKSDANFDVNYTKEGRYFPRVTVKTSDGTLYTTQKNTSLDVKEKPTEAKIDAVTEQINDLERFGGYIWALSDTLIYKIDENNESKVMTISLSGVSNPQGFTIDSNGDIIIADTGNNKIIKLSKSSNYSSKILEFGVAGNANGQLQEPKDVTVSGISQEQEIYVLDSGNHRIQIFNSSGAYLNKIDNANSGLSFTKTQNIIGSSTITLFDNNKIQEVEVTVSNAISKFTITDKFSDISKIGESTNGIVFYDKTKNKIVFLYPNGKIAKQIDSSEEFNILVAFNDNFTLYGALESGGIKKIKISADPVGAKPIDLVKKFVGAYLSDDNATMSSLMHGSDKYKKLYAKEAIAKAVFGAIQSYKEKIDKDFASITAHYKTNDEEGDIKFNLVRSAGQMQSSNDWIITEIY